MSKDTPYSAGYVSGRMAAYGDDLEQCHAKLREAWELIKLADTPEKLEWAFGYQNGIESVIREKRTQGNGR